MLTKEESLTFVQTALGIEQPTELMAKSKLDFLNLLIFRLEHTIPFQSLSLMSEAKEKRHRPSLEEIKASIFEKMGGICYTQNVFMYYFLKSLGYDAFLNHCTVSSSIVYPDNHVIVFVKNVVKPDDLYLVEISIGHPTFHAIPMDFTDETPVIKQSFIEYKYIRHNGKIMRMHGKGDFRSEKPLPFDLYIGNFRRFYEFQLNLTTDIREFDACFDAVYARSDVTPFHSTLRAITFRNQRVVIMVNSRLMLETEDGKFDVTEFDDDLILAKAYKTHFPQFNQHVIQRAVACWRKLQSPKYSS